MPSYELLLTDEYKEFYSLFATLAPEFTHKDLYGCDTESDSYIEDDSLSDIARSNI